MKLKAGVVLALTALLFSSAFVVSSSIAQTVPQARVLEHNIETGITLVVGSWVNEDIATWDAVCKNTLPVAAWFNLELMERHKLFWLIPLGYKQRSVATIYFANPHTPGRHIREPRGRFQHRKTIPRRP